MWMECFESHNLGDDHSEAPEHWACDTLNEVPTYSRHVGSHLSMVKKANTWHILARKMRMSRNIGK